MEVNPLSIILVKSDSKGDRLLFRYPFSITENSEPSNTHRKNPYTLPNVEDLLQSPAQPSSNINNGHLTGFSDEVLSSLFAVKPELCDKKFELKVNDVRFVGHPTLVQLKNREQDDSGMMQVHVVFALQALASHSVVSCYHELSSRIGAALCGEERRRGYVNDQTQTMTAAHDEGDAVASGPDVAFDVILSKCTLAQLLRKVHEDLCSTGIVDVRVNKRLLLSFCLPQKVHQWHFRGKIIEPRDINRCLQALRPYHTILLLYPVEQLVDFVGCDSPSTLLQLLEQYSPVKNLLTIANDADLTLNQVFQLTTQLVYWAKATVIFPICSTNKYVISPDASLTLTSPLLEKFRETFTCHNLIDCISDFALPTSLGQKCNPTSHPDYESHLVKTTIWMLQHHLLLQLHTYVQYIPTDHGYSSSTRKRFVEMGSNNSRSKNTLRWSTSTNSTVESKNEEDSSMVVDSVEQPENRTDDNEEDLLVDFSDEERESIMRIPSARNVEDLRTFVNLCQKGYFQGEHHLEEIMYLERMRRSQVLLILDKFRDVLVMSETEDSAIAMFNY